MDSDDDEGVVLPGRRVVVPAVSAALVTAVEEAVDEYISAIIVLIQCAYETAPIEQRLRISSFMNELGRKLFAYDSMCRHPVDWGAAKRHKCSHCAGTKVTMTLSLVGDEVGDTLAVLNNIDLAFRTERPQDHLSEDVVVCLAPEVAGDSLINETLQTAWKSLEGSGQQTHWAQYREYQGVAGGRVGPRLTSAVIGTPPRNTTLCGPRRLRQRSQEDALLDRQRAYGGAHYSMSGRCLCTS
jgi:hypothetical protein